MYINRDTPSPFMGIKIIDGYAVTFVQMTHMKEPYVNAYVNIPEIKDMNYPFEGIGCECTYHNGDVLGIDTIHGYNKDMTFEEKYQDAVKQIKSVIKEVKGVLNEQSK